MKKQHGFTLVELMIVVAIIGALSAIAIPAYTDYVKKSEANAGLATLKSLQTQAQIVQQETGDFPTNDDAGWKALGARSNMSGLGSIEIGTDSFTFNFDKSALDGGSLKTTLSGTGWTCVASGAHFTGEDLLELAACPTAPPAPPA